LNGISSDDLRRIADSLDELNRLGVDDDGVVKDWAENIAHFPYFVDFFGYAGDFVWCDGYFGFRPSRKEERE